MIKTYLGKLTNVSFKVYEGRIGLWFTLSGSVCCSHSITCWDPEETECSKYAKWTEADRDKVLVIITRKISKLLRQAKVSSICKLNNIPVEFTFKDNVLSDWRILEEVL